MSKVLDAIRRRAAETPDRIALTDGRLSFGWRALEGAIAAAAEWLTHQLAGQPIDAPVALALDNSPAWVVVDLALVRLGRACLPLPPFFTPDQRRHALLDSGACLLLASDVGGGSTAAIAGAVVAAFPLSASDRPLHTGTAKITYTSGSTGAPKGVCLSQAHMEAVAGSLVEAIGTEFAGRHLAILPLGVLLENVAGLYPTLLAGGCYDVRSLTELGFGGSGAPDLRRMASAVKDSGVTSLILTPELLRGLMFVLVQAGMTLPSLKLVAVGGAKVAPQMIMAARTLGLPAYEGYGLSECGSVVTLNTPHADRPGTVGRLLPHPELSIASDGEIVIGGETFLGYVGGPAHHGAYRTGDIGRLDCDGFVSITGRKSSTIITAYGRNVAPEWVESELLAEPEIAQAAVFGEAAPHLCALLVPSRGDLESGAIEAVIARVNARLPDYARIARWQGSAPFDPQRGEVTANGRPRRQTLHAAHREFIDQTI